MGLEADGEFHFHLCTGFLQLKSFIWVTGNAVPYQEDLPSRLQNPLKSGLPAHFIRFAIILNEVVRGDVGSEKDVQVYAVNVGNEAPVIQLDIISDQFASNKQWNNHLVSGLQFDLLPSSIEEAADTVIKLSPHLSFWGRLQGKGVIKEVMASLGYYRSIQ